MAGPIGTTGAVKCRASESLGPPSIADLKKTQCKAAALGTSWLAHRLGHPRGARRTDTDNAKLWAVTLAMLTAVPLVALVAFAAFTALP